MGHKHDKVAKGPAGGVSRVYLGVHYFTVCRLIQRKKLKVRWSPCGKPLVPRTEVLRLLKSE